LGLLDLNIVVVVFMILTFGVVGEIRLVTKPSARVRGKQRIDNDSSRNEILPQYAAEGLKSGTPLPTELGVSLSY